MRQQNIIILLLASLMSNGCNSSFLKQEDNHEADVVYLVAKRSFNTGDPVAFNNISEEARSYSWDFGDGTTSEDHSPVHIYRQPGDYYPVLSARSRTGMKEYSIKLTILGESIGEGIADLKTAKRNNIPVNHNVKIIVSDTILPVGHSFSYSSSADSLRLYWEFETDSTIESTKGEFRYIKPGAYVIRLYWLDGTTLIDNTRIHVFRASVSPQKILVDKEFRFQVEADFDTNWDFGEGTRLSETNGTAAFDAEGIYPVNLVEASSGRVLQRFKVVVEKPLDASVVDGILTSLGNQGIDIQQKDELEKRLVSYCSQADQTPVSGKETGIVDDLIKRLRIESDDFTRVSIKTSIDMDEHGKITVINVQEYNTVNIN